MIMFGSFTEDQDSLINFRDCHERRTFYWLINTDLSFIALRFEPIYPS